MNQIFSIMGASLLLLSACTGNSSQKETASTILNSAQTNVKGDLSDYFEVVEKEYEIEVNSMFNVINVGLKRIGDDLPFDPDRANPFGVDGMDEYQEDYHVGFGIEVLDEKGNVVFSKYATGSGFDGPYGTDCIENVIRLKKGETGIVKWSVDDKVMKDGKTFRITSALKREKGAVSNSNKFSSEWDKVLDSYEKYIDQYAKLYKKAQAGDMSAMTEYTSMLEKANDLSSKLNGAKSDMSAAQIARFTKLQSKLISAVQ